jgi:hypothetical protein
MFLDPFGKELDLPPGFVEPCGRLCRESEVVGLEYDARNGFGVVKRDATQGAGIQPRRLRTCQHDRLVVSQPRCIVDPATNTTAEVESAFSSHHENCRTTRESVKASKIDMSLVHHVERARFDWQMIGNRNIVRFLVRSPHGTGKAAAKVQQCMQLYRPFAVTQPRPRKQPQAEVDAKRLIEIEFSRSADQLLSKLGEDSPVVCAVGIRQETPRNLSTEPRMVQLWLDGTQPRLDVSQPFAKGQLCKCYAEKLISTGEATRTAIATVSPNAPIEVVSRDEVYELSEYQLPGFHTASSTISVGSPGADYGGPG